jgi:integrase
MEHLQLSGYSPKVTVYLYNKPSSCRYWMNYFLPNGKRARRACDDKKPNAIRKARIKQGQLANGAFDDYDRERLGKFLKTEQRLTLEEAKTLYLEITANNKTSRTLKRDEYLLAKAFEFFKSCGSVLIDDVSPLDCVRLISSLKAKGLKRSSIKNYWMVVSKVYNKLRKMKLTKLENPMLDVELPREGKLERDRIPSIDEVHLILSKLETVSVQSSYVSPTSAIIRFTLFTGARIGEVLHAEWSDFDLEEGYWFIRNKPECPGVEGLGWYPKWRKERAVKLFPEALNILKKMPTLETVGNIKDEEGNNIAVPAKFVFPKMHVKIADDCRMKVKKGYYKCFKCREYTDRNECKQRVITYSRCDSIKKAWGTIRREAGIDDLHVHDLRRFFNRVILQEKLGFTPEESGRYIGNSEEVNRDHYSPISTETFERKINTKKFGELIGNSSKYPN